MTEFNDGEGLLSSIDINITTSYTGHSNRVLVGTRCSLTQFVNDTLTRIFSVELRQTLQHPADIN